MNATPILIAALALSLAAPLSASAETSAAKKTSKAQKAQKVHAVSLTSRMATKAAAAPPKGQAVKMRMTQDAEPVEPVYDYASCGCS